MTKRELNPAYLDPAFSSHSAPTFYDSTSLVYATPQLTAETMGESFTNILPTHKKIKLDRIDSGMPGGSTSTSPNSSDSSTLNGNPNQSRVVHLRNVPPETTVADLLMLSNSFGSVTNTLLMKSKGQAFVEFQSPYQATEMVNHWAQTTVNGVPNPVQITLRGRHVQCQLSNHKELKTRAENNNETEKTLKEFQTAMETNGTINGDSKFSGTTSKPSPVIRVVIEIMHYAVNLDMLNSVFSRCGQVQKIVTFMKNGVFQALVQYSDVSEAIKAKQTLNGQQLFLNANIFRIEYSKTHNLSVKYNNEKSCDYTKQLPSGNLASVTSSMAGLSDQSQLHVGNSAAPGSDLHSASAFHLGGHFSADLQDPLRSFQQAACLASLGGRPGNALTNLYAGNNLAGISFSPVVYITGLSESATPDALFTIFGVYGDVVRVKILFNKKETALIQMAEGSQAQQAIANLDRVKLFGSTIRVNTSKHQTVQMPKEGFQDSGLTKDFANSPLHRFKRPGSKNYHNIYPPSETLHVSNIPPTCSEENLREAFIQETGKDITKFRFFPNDTKMALIQFDSVESSIAALIKMHNYKVAEHSHLRVSFSKSSV